MKKLLLFALFFSVWACVPKQGPKKQGPTIVLPADTVSFTSPKNIILMIGDGMGLTQITAGMYINGNKLNLEEFKCIGLHKSYSSDNLVTDSAAGRQLLPAAKKTYNGAIATDDDGNSMRTIMEEVEERGMSTGLVVTSSIVHATPANFFCARKIKGI